MSGTDIAYGLAATAIAVLDQRAASLRFGPLPTRFGDLAGIFDVLTGYLKSIPGRKVQDIALQLVGMPSGLRELAVAEAFQPKYLREQPEVSAAAPKHFGLWSKRWGVCTADLRATSSTGGKRYGRPT
eukprot:3881606-Rhodomonas_salina.4